MATIIINTRENVNKSKPYKLIWECKVVELLWKLVQRFLQQVKTDLPYDPPGPFLSFKAKESKST